MPLENKVEAWTIISVQHIWKPMCIKANSIRICKCRYSKSFLNCNMQLYNETSLSVFSNKQLMGWVDGSLLVYLASSSPPTHEWMMFYSEPSWCSTTAPPGWRAEWKINQVWKGLERQTALKPLYPCFQPTHPCGLSFCLILNSPKYSELVCMAY